jgi:hypothetical protein
MSPAMSAISFVMDGVAHAANDGFVSKAAIDGPCDHHLCKG